MIVFSLGWSRLCDGLVFVIDGLVFFDTLGSNLLPFLPCVMLAQPRFLKARDLIKAGALGRIGDVTYRMSSSHHCNPVGMFASCSGSETLPWRVVREQSGGGLIMDVGCHAIDMLDFLVGPLEDRSSSGDARKVGPFPIMSKVEDVVRLVATGSGGVQISATWNFATPLQEDQFTICGTEGALQFSCFGTEPLKLTRMSKDGEVTTEPYHFEKLEHVQQVFMVQ